MLPLKDPIITVASIPMLSVVLFGSLIGSFVPIIIAIIPQTSASCNGSWWMLHIALGAVFGALTAKNAQLRYIFDATQPFSTLRIAPLAKVLVPVALSVVLTCSIASGMGIVAVPRFTFIMNGAQQGLHFCLLLFPAKRF